MTRQLIGDPRDDLSVDDGVVSDPSFTGERCSYGVKRWSSDPSVNGDRSDDLSVNDRIMARQLMVTGIMSQAVE